RTWQRPDILKIGVGHCVKNEGLTKAGEVEAADIWCSIGPGWRSRWRLAAGLTIKRKRLDCKFAVVSIQRSRAKVRAVEKYLEACGRLDLRSIALLFPRRFRMSSRALVCRLKSARCQHCRNERETERNLHIVAS